MTVNPNSDASTNDLPEHVRRNRAAWDTWASEYEQAGAAAWVNDAPTWGIWDVPESDLRLLPDDLAGKDAIELGCGTAYVSAWMARRGARVVGIDNSATQLATARRLQREHGLEFLLLHGNAEAVPYPDASFDFAISEYGACLWADPQRWVPEAARLLRPGGRLVFLVNSMLMILCAPEDENLAATDRLLRPAFGLGRIEWPGDPGVEFHLTHGDWIRLLRRARFEIEDLVEVRPPETATTGYPFVTLDWARQWPYEEVWKVRKRAESGPRWQPQRTAMTARPPGRRSTARFPTWCLRSRTGRWSEGIWGRFAMCLQRRRRSSFVPAQLRWSRRTRGDDDVQRPARAMPAGRCETTGSSTLFAGKMTGELVRPPFLVGGYWTDLDIKSAETKAEPAYTRYQRPSACSPRESHSSLRPTPNLADEEPSI